MKTIRPFALALTLWCPLILWAQVPQGFSYQAVARASNGDPLASQPVGVQFVLHQGNALGAVVFAETHATTTNVHGLFNLTVGGGTASAGTFNAIEWAAGPFFLEVGLDVGSNGSYVSMGTQQLMSVPYALYAGKSNMPDGTEVGQIAHWTGTAWAVDSGLYVHDRRFGIGVPEPDAPLSILSRGGGYKLFSVTGQPTPVGSVKFTASLPQTTQANGFDIAEDTTGGSASRFFIQQATGNVGLGTTDPTGALTLRTDEPVKVKFQNGDIPQQEDFHNLIDSRGYIIGQGLPDSMVVHVVVQAGTGHLGLGTDAPPAPLTIASRDSLKTFFQTGDIPSQDDFAITTDSTGFGIDQGTPASLTNRVFIASSTGHVGINEKTPDTFLHVSRPESDANSSISLISASGIATFGPITKHVVFDYQGLQARQGTYISNNLQLEVADLNVQPLGGKVVFHGGASTDEEKVVVRSDGRIGVGVLLPAEKLHLNGAVVVGNTDNMAPSNGTIRYTGSDFQGFSAGTWTGLGSVWEKVDNTDGISLLSPPSTKVGINETTPDVALHVTRPTSDPATPLDLGSGIATFGDLIDSNINLQDDGIQARVPAPPGSTHPLAPGTLHLQRLGGDVVLHGDAALASERVILRSNGSVGIGELVPDASLHVRGKEQCDDGNKAVRIENPTTTTSTSATSSRVGLEISCSGVWSSNSAAKSIGLMVSSSGAGNANANLAAVLNGNVVVGGLSSSPAVGTGGTNVLAIQSGAAPSSPPGGSGTPGSAVQLFVSTDASGVSVLNIMNGDGNVIQLHLTNPLSAPDNSNVNPIYDGGTAAVINNMRTRINELEARLQALGLLN